MLESLLLLTESLFLFRRRQVVQPYNPDEDGVNDQNRHQRKAQAAKVQRLREIYPYADPGLLFDVLQESNGHEKVS